MAFTRAELFQNFEGQYTEQQVTEALKKLSEIDASVDPKAQSFDESIVEQLEDIFSIIQDAVNSSKQLPGANLAQVQQTAIGLASDRSCQIPSDVFNSLIEILVGEQFVRAEIVGQLQEAAFKQALLNKEKQSLENLGQDIATRIQVALQLVNDPQTLEAILKDYGIKPKAEVEADIKALNTSTPDFDPDAFLAEVEQGKKPNTSPKTIADTKAMVKSLIGRSLKQ